MIIHPARIILTFALCLFSISCTPGREEAAPVVNGPSAADGSEPDNQLETDQVSPNQKTATYYIRPDGGSLTQCTGTADAPYAASDPDQQPCAWNHPFQAFPPQGTSRIAGGDTLIIGPGSYMIGYGAPGAGACEADYPWDCTMPAIPSGSPGLPTRILGVGWDRECAEPPELWGTERAHYVLNLANSSHVEIACLEISDHAGCAEDHSGGLACERDSFPYGSWAAAGLYAADSNHVTLRDLNIHGLAENGVLAGRLADWTVENVRIAGNGWAGWDGDLEGQDANSGSLTFRRWLVEWNGCVETYPEEQITGCWGQTAGGYGDGLGTGETGGTWIIEDSAFLHNTSDGLDLLYTRLGDSKITIRRTIATGNAGDQIKTSGPTHIENSIFISNCGFFAGRPFTHNVDNCRAGGSAISLSPRTGDQLNIVNSTITGQGDCLIIVECAEGSACDGSETVTLRNSILLGNPEFGEGDDTTCLAWSDLDHQPFIYDHTIISALKAMPELCPANSLCDVVPGVANGDINDFDAQLLPGSPGIDAGTLNGAPEDDFDGRRRDNQPDIGAFEWLEGRS